MRKSKAYAFVSTIAARRAPNNWTHCTFAAHDWISFHTTNRLSDLCFLFFFFCFGNSFRLGGKCSAFDNEYARLLDDPFHCFLDVMLHNTHVHMYLYLLYSIWTSPYAVAYALVRLCGICVGGTGIIGWAVAIRCAILRTHTHTHMHKIAYDRIFFTLMFI